MTAHPPRDRRPRAPAAGSTRAIAELERRRLEKAEARGALNQSFGYVLVRIGKPWVFGLIISLVVLDVVALFVLNSLLLGVIIFAAGIVLWVIIERFFGRWVSEHNARIDAEIQRLRAEGRGDKR